ncbi:15730_t:CDS:2, partial [Acaulospora colombiana]
GPPPSAYTQPDSPVASIASRTAGSPLVVNSPRSPRHPNLPPFMRSLSHAAPVLRRVLSRSRAGTINLDESPTQMTGNSLGAATVPDGAPATAVKGGPAEQEDPNRGRPALPHRLTSGSADESSVVKLTTHVRTNSQPSPSKTSEEQAGSSPTERAPEGGATRPVNLTTTKQRAATASTVGTGTTTSSSSKASPIKRVTRIEEPPLEARHHAHRNLTTSYQEARAVAKRLGASGYMECSALTLVNVVKVFDEA